MEIEKKLTLAWRLGDCRDDGRFVPVIGIERETEVDVR